MDVALIVVCLIGILLLALVIATINGGGDDE